MIPSRPGVDRDGLDGGHGSDPDCFALFRAPLKHCHIGAFRSEKPPKRAHFGHVSKIWIFECEDFIRRVWNWSSYRCKSCKPILSKTFLRPIYRLCRHCKDFPAFLSRFLHFLLLFSNQDRVGGMSAFSHWWFYSRERERGVGWGAEVMQGVEAWDGKEERMGANCHISFHKSDTSLVVQNGAEFPFIRQRKEDNASGIKPPTSFFLNIWELRSTSCSDLSIWVLGLCKFFDL